MIQCGSEGSRSSGVVLAMHHRLSVVATTTRDVRKLNFSSVSVFKNPNRSQKVKPEILVSLSSHRTELVSYK